ncbi:hypothetical protein LB503_008563 [Fusarium chuoi]|nr:hypothetical protein LB503_008563 [Fusarium chuoi]
MVYNTAIFLVPAEMPENGLNRVELQGEAKGDTGAYYELPANGATFLM